MKNEGLIYVYFGNGKGKTSAALGTALRMLLINKKVEWVSWYKEESWQTAEMKLGKVFKKSLKMHWAGKGFLGGLMDHASLDDHKKAALVALSFAKKALGKVDLLVMDEVLTTVTDKLLDIEDLLKTVALRGKTHLVLTGHVCPKEITAVADLVTEMKKVKHPYDKGTMAVSGLDF
jgi:cob(I)alamin adenosyltransferase